MCIFLLLYIDSIIFPTIPEVFTVLIFTTDYGINSLWFAVMILATIAVSEVAGLLSLYMVVRKAKVPTRVHNAVRKYQHFLIYPDERMILLNRIAPVLPFLGAFVALCDWNLRKSIRYTIIGGVVKYGAILALSGLFIAYMEHGMARLVTLVMVLTVVILSFVASMLRKRRMGAGNADRPA